MTLPSRDDPRRPKYWTQESSGVLKPVIEKVVQNAPLAERDLHILRLYLQQWADSPAWDQNPHADERSRQALAALRNTARTINSRADVTQWLQAAQREGMDPL